MKKWKRFVKDMLSPDNLWKSYQHLDSISFDFIVFLSNQKHKDDMVTITISSKTGYKTRDILNYKLVPFHNKLHYSVLKEQHSKCEFTITVTKDDYYIEVSDERNPPIELKNGEKFITTKYARELAEYILDKHMFGFMGMLYIDNIYSMCDTIHLLDKNKE